MKYFYKYTGLNILAIIGILVYSINVEAQTSSSSNDLLKSVTRKFSQIKYITFTYSAIDVPAGLALSGIKDGKGIILENNRVVFDGNIKYSSALSMPFTVVTCGPEQQYLELGDGFFQPMKDAPNIAKVLLMSDSSIILTLLKQLNPTDPSLKKTIDKTEYFYLTGSLPKAVSELLAKKSASTSLKSDSKARAELWIDVKTQVLFKVLLTGKIFEGDVDKTVRTITFSAFNEKQEFVVPRGKIPCKL